MLPEFAKARRHLARRDPALKKLIAQVGPCTLQVSSDRFAVLVRSIISQQISSKAAMSISGRLCVALGKRGLHPRALASLDDDCLRGAGLSGPKMRALRDLTAKVLAGDVELETIHQRDDEAVIEHLVQVRGIGPWTADMFLLSVLGRLDVWPVGDYGVRVGFARGWGLAEVPTAKELSDLGEPFRPYRSLVAWYCWQVLDQTVPIDGAVPDAPDAPSG